MHLPADTDAQIDTFTSVHVCMNVPAVLDVLLALQDQANQQHPEKYRQKVYHAQFLFVPFDRVIPAKVFLILGKFYINWDK